MMLEHVMHVHMYICMHDEYTHDACTQAADAYEVCICGSFTLAKIRLEKGDDVNYYQVGFTCLGRALISGNKKIVSLLLEQPGIDVNAKHGDETALHTKQHGPSAVWPFFGCSWIFQELTEKPRIGLDRLP